MTFWLLIGVYGVARVLQVFRGLVPMPAVVALHVVPPACFALIHGARFYGWRGILTFTAICVAVGNVSENLGVRTGFPFGHYYFTGFMGPKILAVPILLGLAYVGLAYLSWTLARVILGGIDAPLAGWRVCTTPMAAACIMVAWDLSLDPVWSTILRAWVFRDGGAYFGVPVSNFLGWYLTVWLIYQSFALYLRKATATTVRLRTGYWRQALWFYAVSAAGNLLLVIPQAGPAMVTDPAGVAWRVGDITRACALVTVFTMGAFCLLAWARLDDPSSSTI
ncbi:MAG: carotenoid biosynthesis protein [Bryobacteraceae bacterium]